MTEDQIRNVLVSVGERLVEIGSQRRGVSRKQVSRLILRLIEMMVAVWPGDKA